MASSYQMDYWQTTSTTTTPYYPIASTDYWVVPKAEWVNTNSTPTPLADSFYQSARAAAPLGRADRAKTHLPKPKFGDMLAAAFDKIVGGPLKAIDPPTPDQIAKSPFPLHAIGGAASDAEVEYEVIEDPPPSPPPARRKKVVMRRLTGITRDKGGPKPVETHSGTVTFVRQMEGPGHLTENIGIRVEPNGSTNHIEIPEKMLRDALKELEL